MQIVEKVGKILRSHREEKPVEIVHHRVTLGSKETRIVELVMQRFALGIKRRRDFSFLNSS